MKRRGENIDSQNCWRAIERQELGDLVKGVSECDGGDVQRVITQRSSGMYTEEAVAQSISPLEG